MASHQRTTKRLKITRETVNGFRYLAAVNTHGQGVFAQVTTWLYQGGPSIKTYFRSLGYAGKDYKLKFNGGQRKLLERGVPFKEYDIALLYTILQTMCGLQSYNDPIWSTPSSEQPLEHLLFKLKLIRNDMEHSNSAQEMSDQELKKKLRKLKCLLSRILRLAGIRCGISPNVFREKVWKIKKSFQDLQQKVREPLQVSDLDKLPQLQQEIKFFQEIIRKKVLEDSQQELQKLYPQVWDVPLAQWLYPDHKIRPSLNFTHLVIKEDMSSFLPSQQQPPRDISYTDLLQTTRRDGHLPEVIIISGEGGIGKTTLLKHMLEMWVTDPSQINGLKDAAILLYLQLRGSTISSWKDLITHLLYKTFQDSGLAVDSFVDLFLTFRIVVLLDGYDEVSKVTKNLISDILSYRTNMQVVITTRPGSLRELNHIVQGKKPTMNIEIKGISRKDRLPFIEKTLNVIVHDASRIEGFKDKIVTNLENLNLRKNVLDVPLTLTLIIIREVEAPDLVSRDIYGDLTSLMKGKIEERLALKGIDDADDKIEQFHEFKNKIALKCLKTREHDLLPETVQELKSKCASLNMPYREVFSGFFVSKKTRQGLIFVHIWSFPHNRFQEHWAAGYIVANLLNMSLSLSDMTDLLKMPILTDFKEKTGGNFNDTPAEDNLVASMFNKNPILQIYADDIEEAKKLSWMNIGGEGSRLLMDVLGNITRILSISQSNFLGEIATAVISLLLYSDQSHLVINDRCDIFCELIMAAGQHPGFLEASAKALSSFDKFKVYGDSMPGLVPLIDYVKVSSVEVWLQKDSEDIPTKQQLACLEELARKNIEWSLITSYLRESIIFSETCLQAATNCGFSRLTKFEGNLTEKGIMLLPESLTELNTISDGAGLRALVLRLPQLQNLGALNFKGELTKEEVLILPSILTVLNISTDGEGLQAMAERIPWLINLQDLTIELMDAPTVDSLIAIPYEGKNLWFRPKKLPLYSPQWKWVCNVTQRLWSTRKQDSVLFYSKLFENQKKSILQGLKDLGAKALFSFSVGIQFCFVTENTI